MSLKEVDLMMETPGDERWQKEWDLQHVIDSDTTKRFAKTCKTLKIVLEQISDTLGSVEKTQVCPFVFFSYALY
jgi:hypothetical protein